MSKNRYTDANVVCPFYAGEDRWRIFCEGICKGTTMQVSFGNEKDKRPFKDKRCKGCYRECLLAEALLKKYEEEKK